jgi:hypothetical protein
VRAERGTAWLTIDGRPEDISLDRGESHRIAGRGTALVTALGGEVVVSLVPPAGANASPRFWCGRRCRWPRSLCRVRPACS